MREFLGERPRWPNQPHACFTEQPVTFPPVTAPARDHLVLPAVRSSATRGGNDVIDRELRRRHALAAVLAATVVTQQQIAPVGPQQTPRDLDVGKQPADRARSWRRRTRPGVGSAGYPRTVPGCARSSRIPGWWRTPG